MITFDNMLIIRLRLGSMSRLLLVGLMMMLTWQIHTKEAPVDYYPAEFATLVEADWTSMCAALDRTSGNQSEDSKEKTYAYYLLARIARIPWGNDRRQEVADKLLSFASRMLETSPAFVPDEVDRQPFMPGPSFLSARAVRSYGEVAHHLNMVEITHVWSSTMPARLQPYQGPQARRSVLRMLDKKNGGM